MFRELFQVIPVAIGAETDRNELEKITSNRKNIITSAKSEEPEVLGKKVMKSILKGMLNSNILGNILSFRNLTRFDSVCSCLCLSCLSKASLNETRICTPVILSKSVSLGLLARTQIQS